MLPYKPAFTSYTRCAIFTCGCAHLSVVMSRQVVISSPALLLGMTRMGEYFLSCHQATRNVAFLEVGSMVNAGFLQGALHKTRLELSSAWES